MNWKGYYVQYEEEPMHFNSFQITAGAERKVNAEGSDVAGSFTMEGTVDNSTSNVTILKKYDTHVIHYNGSIKRQNGQTVIEGYWGFYVGDSQQPFKLWTD